MKNQLFIYLLSLPLYYLMYLVKPQKNLWIFGAWYGEKYFDNPKFLFEYVKLSYPNIKVIWITKDKSICDNKNFIYKNSFKAYYYAFFGEIFCVTHSTVIDLFPFINGYKRKIIQLWHGIPIKKIGADDNRDIGSRSVYKLKFLLFPFLKEDYSLVISSSDADQKNMATAFSMPTDKVAVTGYPRNDILLNRKTVNNKFRILYAPTLRDKVNDEVNLFDDFSFDSKKVISVLEKNKVYLDIKMHPANKIDAIFKNSIKSGYIQFLESKIEINEILQDYSIIISDYSGIYVDYLLIDRPIIFAPFDYEKYITKDRELYYDYDEVSPGPKCRNWDEVLEWIIKFKEDPVLYKENRETVKNRFHKYQDSDSCERVYNEIIKLDCQ